MRFFFFEPPEKCHRFVKFFGQNCLEILNSGSFFLLEVFSTNWLQCTNVTSFDRNKTRANDFSAAVTELYVQVVSQVWPLTRFFPFGVCKKSLVCLTGRLMISHWRWYCYLSFLPATPSSQFRAFKGLFKLTQRPLRAIGTSKAPSGVLHWARMSQDA